MVQPAGGRHPPPEQLAHHAASAGYKAVALTDTNSLAGAVELVSACTAAGVRPILGARLAHGNRRATVLVAEPAGYRGLLAAVAVRQDRVVVHLRP